MSTPASPKVADMGQAVFETVVADVHHATMPYPHDNQLIVPQHTHLISATVTAT